jgi:hypothetical protein
VTAPAIVSRLTKEKLNFRTWAGHLTCCDARSIVWQYEVTGGGRIWYMIDDARRTAWITYAGSGHSKATD